MHAWIDYGIDSERGKASYEQLNQIHGLFADKTRNEDFVYVLCSFITDTIRFVDVFGWRQLTDLEKQGLFYFWAKLGTRMNIKNIPTTLEGAYKVVNDYIDSDNTSKDTEKGRVLTKAITNLLKEWYFLIPSPLIDRGTVGLLYIIGGPTFTKKLGLDTPSTLILGLIYGVASLRRMIVSFFLPPRSKPHYLSNLLMQKSYGCPAASSHFKKVGPEPILSALNKKH